MKSTAIFVVGLMAGLVLRGAAQSNDSGRLLALSHVAVSAANFDRTLDFYQKAMGLRPAFSVPGPDGKPALTYVQISRETFVEIQPSNANRAPGINHFGVEVDNIEATVARLKKNGVEVTNPRSSGTGAKLANVSAPDGVTIELLELGPETAHKKAMQAWK
jgi:catechol 2,3-dioxygenase-like lactoylglutathione lyase family enzyme